MIKIKCIRLHIIPIIIFVFCLSACGGEGRGKDSSVSTITPIATIKEISPLIGNAGQQITFDVKGENLPLTLLVSIADAVCRMPNIQTTSNFSVQCTLGYNVGEKLMEVRNGTTLIGSASVIVKETLPTANVATVSPSDIIRNLTGNFYITGSNLPTAGVGISIPSDSNASCGAPTNFTSNGFSVSCVFEKTGIQVIEVRSGTTLIGSVSVFVKEMMPTANVASVSPIETIRNLTGNFYITGSNLPAAGVSISIPSDSNASCKSPTNFTSNGFSVACVFEKTGMQVIEVRNGTALIGSVSVFVKEILPTANIDSVSPSEIIRTLTGNFYITGKNLPTTGISITIPSDSNANCKVPTNLTANGLSVECIFKKIGKQIIEIRFGAQLIGSVNIMVKTNVTGVTWTSLSTTTSGAVKFGEEVTFKVNGLNLLSDANMGFVVSQCDIPNTSTGNSTSIARSFICTFTQVTGADPGQKLGVVKDSPNGQVLLDGWEVPVIASAPDSVKVTDTGITQNQCHQLGGNVLVSCASSGALALNDKQDGMLGRDVTHPDNSDGKLGFSFSLVLKPSGGSYDRTECVKDNVTGLIWEGKPTSGPRMNLSRYTNYGDGRIGDASVYIKEINSLGLCGYTDWRLPKLNELESIVDYSMPYQSPSVDSTWFPNTLVNNYWSSTYTSGNTTGAWYINFFDGSITTDGRFGLCHVRLVR